MMRMKLGIDYCKRAVVFPTTYFSLLIEFCRVGGLIREEIFKSQFRFRLSLSNVAFE